MRKLEKIALWAYVVGMILAVAMIYCLYKVNGWGFIICGYSCCFAFGVFAWADWRKRKSYSY